MKKFFLAFSIVLSFSFSWAESDRTEASGTDRKLEMSQDGAGVNKLGNKGVCADCAKHSREYRLFDNTAASPFPATTDKEGGSKAEDGTR